MIDRKDIESKVIGSKIVGLNRSSSYLYIELDDGTMLNVDLEGGSSCGYLDVYLDYEA